MSRAARVGAATRRGRCEMTGSMTTAAAPPESARFETVSELPYPSASPPAIGPVLGRERIEVMDILRGVAILEILVVNMGLFSLPEGLAANQVWPNSVDGTVERLILLFAQEKFKALFSFLFGLSLAVHCVLFVVGLALFLLLWDGDILHDSGVLGFVLLLFRRRSLKTLLVWASIFLSVPVLFYGLTTYYSITRELNPQLMIWISHANEAEDPKSIEETRRICSRGTYLEIIEFRARELPRDLAPDTEDAYLMTIILLGLYAGRRGIFHDISGHLPFIRRVQRWGLMIGIAGNAAFAAGGSLDPSPTSVMQNVGRTCLVICRPR